MHWCYFILYKNKIISRSTMDLQCWKVTKHIYFSNMDSGQKSNNI